MKNGFAIPLPNGRCVTLRDIAKVAGLHFSTVSLALRDSPRLAKPTRLRIKKIARRLGYRPDPMLSALNVYRRANSAPPYHATIAWINNWPRRELLFERHEFREYYQGAVERADQLGYVVEEFWLHGPGMDPGRLASILRARNIQALLLAPQPNPNMPLVIDPGEFSAVNFGYSMQPAVLNVVTNHQFHSMGMMLRHLLELGYRRPGLCIPTEMDDKAESNYLSCLLLSQWKHPELTSVPPLLLNDDRKASSTELLKGWVRKHRPDVVIGLAHLAARLQKLGLAIPGQIGFANLSVDEGDAYWSGTHQNSKIIGRKAVDLLVGMLHRGERGIPPVPFRTLVESTWMPGKTVRKQRPGKLAKDG